MSLKGCCKVEINLPCLDNVDLENGDSDVIDILDITFVILKLIANACHKFEKKTNFIVRIWIGYIVDAVELLIMSINTSGLRLDHWFGQILFGVYVICLVVFASIVSLMEFCCNISITRYWMRIFIVFKLTSFLNALFVFVYPLVISDSHDIEAYEIFLMFVTVLDMIFILLVSVISILGFGKCLRKGNGVQPQKDSRKAGQTKMKYAKKRKSKRKI